jgi:hypothetical protein
MKYNIYVPKCEASEALTAFVDMIESGKIDIAEIKKLIPLMTLEERIQVDKIFKADIARRLRNLFSHSLCS